MIRVSAAAFGLLFLPIAGYGQGQDTAKTPFVLTWSQGRCLGCKIAAELGHVQFVNRKDVWALGPKGDRGGGNFIVVHSTDAGRTWTELPQTHQYAGDPDGPPAFSFLDAMRGWIAWWNPTDEPKIITTRDGGQHWQQVSQQPLQRIQMVDDNRGYGTGAEVGIAGAEFYRTSDGGRSWSGTKIPDIGYIDHLFFLTPEVGWITGTAGIHGTDFFVYRTVNGGRDWEESRTTPPQPPQRVRDLFFLDQQRGWLTTWNDGRTYFSSYLYSTVDGGKHWTPEPDLSFQGKGMLATVVRFTSKERGFVFVNDNGQDRLAYTADGGTHWYRQALPRPVYDCQVFGGDLLCSSEPGFSLLTVHPK